MDKVVHKMNCFTIKQILSLNTPSFLWFHVGHCRDDRIYFVVGLQKKNNKNLKLATRVIGRCHCKTCN